MKKNFILTLIVLLFFGTKLVYSQGLNVETSQVQALVAHLPQVNDEKVNIQISSQFQDAYSHIQHIYFYQTLNGLPIFTQTGSIHLNSAGAIIKSDFNYLPQAAEKVKSSSTNVTAQQAMLTLASDIGVSLSNQVKSKNKWETRFEMNDPSSKTPIIADAGYWVIDNEVIPVWKVNLHAYKGNSLWSALIHRGNGQLISKVDLTSHCGAHNIRQRTHANTAFVFSDEPQSKSLHKSNNATYRVVERPNENPNSGPLNLVNNPSNPKASPYGWHDTDGVAGAECTNTRGNNVYAKDDIAGNDSDNGSSPDGGSNLVFDFPFSPTNPAKQNLNAAIVNLFYWNNIMHDVTYQYGFDEVSGNFQSMNYSNKGLGQDEVYADSEDGSSTNNADFATYPDGQRPRMQMYVWPTTGTGKVLFMDGDSATNGGYASISASFGSTINSTPVSGELVYPTDSKGTNLGCNSFAPGSLDGKVAIIYRGTCTFISKVQNAQSAGAIGAIVINNSNTAIFAMGGNGTVNIPTVMISKADGDKLVAALANASITATFVDSGMKVSAYEGEFDAGIVCHEYGHGISNRLVGGAANTECLNNREAPGEGWSDMFALIMTDKYGYTDARSDRGMGNYVMGMDSSGLGMRNYKYSRNMTVNPVTYNTIKSGGYSETHALGFVYCTMMYDCYLNLIDSMGFDPDIYAGKGGNNIFLHLLVEGFKWMPCSPGFVDARNGLLSADSALFQSRFHNLIWRSFARRGLGYSAKQGSTTSTTDGTAAFDLPPTSSTGINELQDYTLTLFPNPTRNELSIRSNDAIQNIEIFDISGKSVHFSIKQKTNGKQWDINVSELPVGVYMLRCHTNLGQQTQKLLIHSFE